MRAGRRHPPHDVSQSLSASAGRRGVLRAVDRLDLEVGQGQMLALLGKTGCGKSTIFNMIAGIDDADVGRGAR